MALTSTMHTFDVALSDVDRSVYESLTIKAACHPSETEEYLVTRVLAYCLEYQEGIAFSKGLGEPDEPALSVRDLTGALKSWIEVGAPDAARLHRASKASPRLAVYTHKEPRLFLRAYEGQRIHRAESVELYAVDRDLLAEVVQRLERRLRFALTVTEGQLFLDFGGDSVSGSVSRLTLG
ncbi:MAG: YaeQ family protein [Gemmatimonadaceae bacterium]|nr:YaeQ family protein [Gemmatimonadaceae bacterium]